MQLSRCPQRGRPLQLRALQLFAEAGVTAARIRAAALLPWLFVVTLPTGIKYASWFRVGGKKKKNIQEMKAVTRSCVCQASPRAGTKGQRKAAGSISAFI